MEAKRVMNGKYADLYIDGDLMAEATAFKAEVTLTKEEVKMLRHMSARATRSRAMTAKGS